MTLDDILRNLGISDNTIDMLRNSNLWSNLERFNNPYDVMKELYRTLIGPFIRSQYKFTHTYINSIINNAQRTQQGEIILRGLINEETIRTSLEILNGQNGNLQRNMQNDINMLLDTLAKRDPYLGMYLTADRTGYVSSFRDVSSTVKEAGRDIIGSSIVLSLLHQFSGLPLLIDSKGGIPEILSASQFTRVLDFYGAPIWGDSPLSIADSMKSVEDFYLAVTATNLTAAKILSDLLKTPILRYLQLVEQVHDYAEKEAIKAHYSILESGGTPEDAIRESGDTYLKTLTQELKDGLSKAFVGIGIPNIQNTIVLAKALYDNGYRALDIFRTYGGYDNGGAVTITV